MLDTVDINSFEKGRYPPPDLDLAVLIGDRHSSALRKNLMLKTRGRSPMFYGSLPDQAARISRRKRQI
jgi:hypothetical protein